MSELLTKEQLAEIEKRAPYWQNVRDGHVSLTVVERDALCARLRLAIAADQLRKPASVEDFRRRAIRAVWKDVEIYGPIDLGRTVETLESLPATSEEVDYE